MRSASSNNLFRALAGDLQGWATAIFGDRFAAQAALAAVPDARRHLWLMVFAQFTHRAERVDNPADLSMWRERLLHASRREIAEMAGFGECLGLRRCLSRLDWRAFDRSESYLTLMDALSDSGSARKALFHASAINERTVEIIRALDADLRTREIIGSLMANGRHTPALVRQFCWRIRRLRERSPRLARYIVDAVARSENPADDHLWYEAGFPAPPWAGTPILKPLTSPEMIARAGADFRNCLTHWSSSVRDGKTYFYRLADIAIVELVAIRGIGWEIFQAYGHRNQLLGDAEHAALRRELSWAPPFICTEIPDYRTSRDHA
jgi:hypothetical protein